MDNIIFFFSGTGNCLKAAKDISKELENCEIVSMAKSFNFLKQYDSIGFIYPTYFWGLPKKVIEFIENINLKNNQKAYFYGITTYGGSAGNAIYQLYELLYKKHDIKLNYGQGLQMFSNYVVMYQMRENINEISERSKEKFVPIINSIKERRNNRINKLTKVFGFINRGFIKKVSNMDNDYNINDKCKSCGICEKVCPVKNIEMLNNKPVFKHHCENCIACIQYCPEKALNYKNATQNRRRYTNPEIDYMELYKYNK